MEYNVEEVLVSPGDVVLVFLVERMKEILPRQASWDHTVLKYQLLTVTHKHLESKAPLVFFCFCLYIYIYI